MLLKKDKDENEDDKEDTRRRKRTRAKDVEEEAVKNACQHTDRQAERQSGRQAGTGKQTGVNAKTVNTYLESSCPRSPESEPSRWGPACPMLPEGCSSPRYACPTYLQKGKKERVRQLLHLHRY